MTDTPNVNPLVQDQPVRPRLPPRSGTQGETTEELKIDAGTQTSPAHPTLRSSSTKVTLMHASAPIGCSADKATVYEATNKVIAEGNVVFDQGEQQRITGTRAEWNYRTKTGFFVDSTGFTNQTEDGTRIYFTADSR